MIEQLLLGLAAFRVGERIEYDSTAGRVTNNAYTNAPLSRKYREDWRLDGQAYVALLTGRVPLIGSAESCGMVNRVQIDRQSRSTIPRRSIRPAGLFAGDNRVS